jgi:nucleotide-binding universal stress UspA family protein
MRREGVPLLFKKILFCTDFSENSHYAFRYALSLASAYKARLLILHCIVEPVCYYWSTPRNVDQLVSFQTQRARQEIALHYGRRLEESADYEILTKVTDEGRAFFEILEAAREKGAELIVMGTHGRTGLNHLILGSTAENVVRKSSCPVLTVRMPER